MAASTAACNHSNPTCSMGNSRLDRVAEVSIEFLAALYTMVLQVLKEWRQYCLDATDGRVKDWLFMGDPLPILIIEIIYLSTVFLLPKYMKNREPFSLRPLIFVYNTFLVALSFYMAYELGISAYLAKLGLWCQVVDYSDDPNAVRMAKACWWFSFSKIIELMDTVFFILRKKDSQVTFLHVYHHGSMIWNWWAGASYIAGGQSYLNAFINSIVHVFMYSYYALSSLGPWMQPYLFWKRHITHMQLTQFVIIVVHTGTNAFIVQPCDFPQGFNYLLFGYCISMLFLFSNFYIRSYLNRKSAKKIHSNGTTRHVHKNGAVTNGHVHLKDN